MVDQALLVLALLAAVVSVPFALLSALYLAGADDVPNNAVASLVGVLVAPASILSVLAVLGLVRGDPMPHTELVLFAPAAVAAVAGPFAGPRSMHHATPHQGDVMTSRGYFRPGDPGYPQPEEPSRRRLLAEVAKMVGLLLVVPALVLATRLLG